MTTLEHVLLGLAAFYASAHAIISVIAPKLPPPAEVPSKWYPAVYQALQWIALGNGGK